MGPLVCLHASDTGRATSPGSAAASPVDTASSQLDWPGHGSSDDDRVPASAGRYAVLLAGVLDALGIERAEHPRQLDRRRGRDPVRAAHPDRVRATRPREPGRPAIAAAADA
jgi:hypothetical protein